MFLIRINIVRLLNIRNKDKTEKRKATLHDRMAYTMQRSD